MAATADATVGAAFGAVFVSGDVLLEALGAVSTTGATLVVSVSIDVVTAFDA